MSKPTPCEACGSTRTVMTEGKLFCAVCRTQIEQFFELDEVEAGTLLIHHSTHIRQKKVVEVVEGVDLEENENDMTTVRNGPVVKRHKRKNEELYAAKVPRNLEDRSFSDGYRALLGDSQRHPRHEHLGSVGARLGSFSKALMKISSVMRVELGFPESYPKQCLCLYQRYLQKCGAAYINKEHTEEEEKMFRKAYMVKRKLHEIKEVKKQRKLAKKKRGLNRLQKSKDAWSILLDKNMTENFELDSDEEQNEEDNYDVHTRYNMKVFASNLDQTVMKAGLGCYLSTDLLVGILFVAAVSLRCGWVMVSDIVRWIREDRGRIFGEITSFISYAGSGCSSLHAFVADLSIPLYEFMRLALWFWQSVDIDTSKISIDFPQLVSRVLYNLNLPTDLIERVLFLADCAPPSLQMDDVYLRQQGDVNEGISCKRLRDPSFITQCFGRQSSSYMNQNIDVFLSTETKVLSYVLLALKLAYGFDDSREYTIPTDSSDAFPVIEWMYQLRMREMIWNGHALSDVLSQSKPVCPMKYQLDVKDNDYVIRTDGRFQLHQAVRGGHFDGCLPATTNCESAFNVTNPFAEELRENTHRNDEDMVYAVLRGQATKAKAYLSRERTAEQREKVNESLSPDAVRVLHRDYANCDIIGPSGSGADSTKPVEKTEERCQTKRESLRWQELFPSSKEYIMYPRPLWAQGMVVYGRETDPRMRRLNNRMKKSKKMAGPRSLYLSYRGVADLHRAACTSWSPSFADLLSMLSKSIGEHSFLLYAAFSMLETQILRRKQYEYVRSRMIEGSTVPLSYAVKSASDMGDEVEHGTVRVSAMEEIREGRELRWLRFGVPRDWALGMCDEEESDESGASSSSSSESTSADFEPLSDSEDDAEPIADAAAHGSDEEPAPEAEMNKLSRLMTGLRMQNRFHTRLYDWDSFWQLLTMKYW